LVCNSTDFENRDNDAQNTAGFLVWISTQTVQF